MHREMITANARKFGFPRHGIGLLVLGIFFQAATLHALEYPPEAFVPETVRGFLRGNQPSDYRPLYEFLRTGPLAESDGHPLDAVKDMVLNRLCNMPTPPPGLAGELADIISDVNAERIGRVYGVQYLASFYARKAGESDEWSQTEEAEKARVSFFSALLDADTLLQGTALISLTELTAARPEIDRTALTDKALHSVRSSDTSPTVRAASFQYCARFKIPMALEAARIWAEKTDEVFVSMSALYLIGEIGTNEDARKVRHWMNQPRQKAKRRAMEIALAKIERRQKDSHKTDLMEENDDGLHQR